jgi:hypothetical protein
MKERSPMTPPPAIRTIVCLLLAAACSPGTNTEPPRVVVSDSAGIRIVSNHVPEAETASLAIREELRIGSLDGPEAYQLFQVRPMAAAPDGRLFVPLLRANEIRVFSESGEHLGTIGRTGEGPGEFTLLASVHVEGDLLFAMDWGMNRVTTFTLDGELVSTSPFPRGESGTVRPDARLAGSWLFWVPDPYDWPEHGRSVEMGARLVVTVELSELPARLSAPDGAEATGSAWPVVSSGRMFGMRMGTALTGQTPLWEPRQRWATDGRGRLWVTAPDRYQIDAYAPDGSLISRIRRSHDPTPITPQMKGRFLAAVVAHHDTVQVATEFGTDPVEPHRFRTELPTRPALPPLGRVIAAPEGAILVERPDLIADPVAHEWSRVGPFPTHWDLFDAEGSFVGTILFPERFTPHAFDGTSVIGVGRDELGVEYVVRYGIAFD